MPPQNSWHPYTKAVYFNEATGLAVLSVSKSEEELNAPQLESAVGSLRYVRKINEENGCTSLGSNGDTVGQYHLFGGSNATTTGGPSRPCWLPVVYHSDDSDQFASFLSGMIELPPHLQPALLIDTGGNFEGEYGEPKLVTDQMWVGSHALDSRSYFHHRLHVSRLSGVLPKLAGVEFLSAPLSPLPDEVKDGTYRSEIQSLRRIADVALESNPVVGYSERMPVTRDSSKYRPCKSGECVSLWAVLFKFLDACCLATVDSSSDPVLDLTLSHMKPIGNLYTDAARWYADADVAFITSGGVRGPGWPAGGVTVADVWSALPFPNNLCTGRMNGVHLFKLLNYSMSVSTFEGVGEFWRT